MEETKWKRIGLQFGNGRDMGGNGATVEDCYLSSLEKGVVTHAQACLISRPIIELCRTGIETHGITSVVIDRDGVVHAMDLEKFPRPRDPPSGRADKA